MLNDLPRDQYPQNPWTNPAATLVCTAATERDEWLAKRRDMVCASDVAALMGVSKYGDATTVWADKTGRSAPEPANDAMRRGQLLEDAIVNLWTERYAEFPIMTRRQGLLRSKRNAHAGATVDRRSICLMDGTPSRCCVEVKSQANMAEWEGDAGEPEVPVAFQYQGLWQLYVTGLDHVHYIALGPRFVPEHRVIRRDDPLIDHMASVVQMFWAEHVEADVAPNPSSKALDAVRKLYRGAPGAVAYVTDELAPFVHQAVEAKLVLAAAKDDLDAAVAKLMLHMGDATKLCWPGDDEHPVLTWNVSPKTIDGADKDWRKANPELVEQFSMPGPDVVDVAKMVENHPELIDSRSLRYRRTFTWK